MSSWPSGWEKQPSHRVTLSLEKPQERARSRTAAIAYSPCAGVLWRRTKNQEPDSRQVAFVLRRRDFLAWTAVNYAVPWEAASFHSR